MFIKGLENNIIDKNIETAHNNLCGTVHDEPTCHVCTN